jgi:phage-related protein
VFAALGQTFGGQAAAQADTAQGRMKNLSIQMGELKESVGAAVAPIIEKLLPAFQGLTNWISNNTGLVVGLGVTIGGIALAISGANAAMVAWNAITKITAALNAILGTSFTALWVATGVGIILAIIAAVVALQAKFGLFTPVINFVKSLFQGFWDFVSSVFGWIYDKIKLVADFYAAIWGTVIDLVKGYFNIWWTVVSTVVDKVVGVFRTAAELIGGIVKGIIDGFIAAFKAGINTLIDLINKAIRAYNKIPLVPNLPTIPKLAEGGIVTGPTLAMIGEKGPEAVIPLDRMMGGNITVNVAGSVTSERDLIETIRRGLVNAQRNGAQLVYSNT